MTGGVTDPILCLQESLVERQNVGLGSAKYQALSFLGYFPTEGLLHALKNT